MCAGAAGPRRSCSTARGTSTCAVKGRSLAAATATAAWPGRVAPRQPTLGLERPRTWAARSQQRPSLPGSRAGAFNTLAMLARPRLRLRVVFAPSPVEAEASVQRCHLTRRRRARPPAAKGRWQRVEHGGPATAAATRSVLTGERLWRAAQANGELIRYTFIRPSRPLELLPGPHVRDPRHRPRRQRLCIWSSAHKTRGLPGARPPRSERPPSPSRSSARRSPGRGSPRSSSASQTNAVCGSSAVRRSSSAPRSRWCCRAPRPRRRPTRAPRRPRCGTRAVAARGA